MKPDETPPRLASPPAESPPTENPFHFNEGLNSPSRVPQAPSPGLETCDAVIVGLRSRRFVVVYRDRRIPILPVDQICRSIRTLRPGDSVRYKNGIDTVTVLEIY